jgi:hypothetical protein
MDINKADAFCEPRSIALFCLKTPNVEKGCHFDKKQTMGGAS